MLRTANYQAVGSERLSLIVSTLLLSIGIAVGGLAASAAEIDVSLSTLPENVQKAVRRIVGHGQIVKTSKETEKDGRVIYEVSYRVGEKKFEAEFSARGELIVVDEEISLSAAPHAVAS